MNEYAQAQSVGASASSRGLSGPSTGGPVTSAAINNCVLSNDVLSAIARLASKIEPILGCQVPDEDANAKQESSCELHSRLTNVDENLRNAVAQLDQLHGRVRL